MEPVFVSPCLACRRRVRWHGRLVFSTCSCVKHGRGITIAALALGLSVGALGLLWRLGRRGR